MSFEQIVRVPLERVGVIIGKGGSTRKSFEEELGVVLSVDSKSGSVIVKCESIEKGDPMKAVRVVEAIGMGFSPQRAHRLLGEEVAFEGIDLTDFAGNSVTVLGRITARITGAN